MDIEEFYDENPARRSSEELEWGTDWSDTDGARCELSWVEATGELYVMREPVEPIITDMFGDEYLQRLPTESLTVEVLGTVTDRERLDQMLNGWESAMGAPNSLAWVRQRLADAPSSTSRHDSESAETAIAIRGDDDHSSVIISAAIQSLQTKLPPAQASKLEQFRRQAMRAGSNPTAEWHRAFACARWADQIVAIPAHHHLSADAAKAIEVVREVGTTIGAQVRDLEYLPFGKAVSPRFQTELAWVYEAVHVAGKVAEQSGWDAVPWERLLQNMFDIPSITRG